MDQSIHKCFSSFQTPPLRIINLEFPKRKTKEEEKSKYRPFPDFQGEKLPFPLRSFPLLMPRCPRRPDSDRAFKKSSGKNLHYTIASATNDPAPIGTPHNGAHAFAPHMSVTDDFLRAAAFFERPETKTGVVTTRHELVTFRR